MPRVFSDPSELQTLLGQEVAVGDWFTMDQSLINAFATATGDFQWIHCDPPRAKKESPLGTTIAHGFFTLGLVSQWHNQAIQIQGFSRTINYGLNRVRFPAPVRAGCRLRAHFTLQNFEILSDCKQITWLIQVEIENHPKLALVAEWIIRGY